MVLSSSLVDGLPIGTPHEAGYLWLTPLAGTAVASQTREGESTRAFFSQLFRAGVMGEHKSLDICVKIDAVKTDFSLPSQTTLGDIAILVSNLAERVGAPVQEVTVTGR